MSEKNNKILKIISIIIIILLIVGIVAYLLLRNNKPNTNIDETVKNKEEVQTITNEKGEIENVLSSITEARFDFDNVSFYDFKIKDTGDGGNVIETTIENKTDDVLSIGFTINFLDANESIIYSSSSSCTYEANHIENVEISVPANVVMARNINVVLD